VRSLDGTVLVKAEGKHRIFFTAILPRFGMAKVEMDCYREFVYLVACPDVVAMRGMSEARVGWMVAMARGSLQLFPQISSKV